MRLPREGLEYARLDFDNQPANGVLVEASLDRINWVSTVLNGSDYLFLLRGPSSTAQAGTLVTAGCTIWARLTGTPEVIIRKVGIVTLY